MFWKGVISITLATVFMGVGCTSGDEQKSIFNPYKNETTGETTRDCSSLEPENPYSSGSGHYAGYEWGENGKTCSGNSASFREGCNTYEEQEQEYENCVDG